MRRDLVNSISFGIFSIPRPHVEIHEKTGKENIHLDESLFDKDLNNKVLEDNLNDPVHHSKKFYMHLKPESHGTKTLGDFVGHSASFLASRFGPKYKGLPIFYGEKSGFSKDGEGQLKESGNGSFVIDISEYDKPKT